MVLILGVVVLAQGNAMAERARHNAASGAAAQPVLKAKEAQ
ncbi:MAG TPA: hypothetical protein PLE19_08690 [Planctomycetota bacterium]|nr:hypothetical protein [Planctomycetota bacterium]HRT93741.1 hypothetical protein [Planctomycetota bacterium]